MPRRTPAAPPALVVVATAAILVLALALAIAGCGSAPGSTVPPATGGIGNGLVEGSPAIDVEPAVPELPNELVPPNSFIVDTRVRDGALIVRMSSGLSEDELVDFYARALRGLGADPAVSSDGGARVIAYDSEEAGSGEVRITQGTPTTIELIVRS